MSVFDGFLNMMRLGPDDDDDFYDDGYDDDVEEKPRASRKQQTAAAAPEFTDTEPVSDVKRPKEKASNKITPMRSTSRRSQTAAGMEVCVIKPPSASPQNR